MNVPIVVIRTLEARAVTTVHLGDPSRLWGKAVLIHTGWTRHWGTDHYLDLDNPFLATDAVDVLLAGNAAIVGIDSPNIDDPTAAAVLRTIGCSARISRSSSTSPTCTQSRTTARA